MSPLKRSNNLAARMGRWSASHWKTAVFGWLLFVVLSFAIGAKVGTKQINQNDTNVGQSKKADKILREAGFGGQKKESDPLEELVLVQNKKLTIKDPSFRATVGEVVDMVGQHSTRVIQNLHDPRLPQHADLVSADGHTVLVTWAMKGTSDTAKKRIDAFSNATDKLAKEHPAYYIGEAGAVSSDKALTEMFNKQLKQAGERSVPLTLIVLLIVFGALVAAGVPLLLALSAVIATIGLTALPSHIIPMDQNVAAVILLVGLAVGVDYSLFYLKREREERAAGKDHRAALEAAAATSGRSVLISGFTVIIAMGGMLFAGDKGYMSMGVATMMVVAVAMIGSLTVLPALLSRLGDRVEKGKVPFLHRLRRSDAGENRFWSAILTPVLRHPVISALASGAVLLALALPVLHLHTAQSGFDALPKNAPTVATIDKIDDAFPGNSMPANVAIKADTDSPAVKHAIADIKRQALGSGQMQNPIDVEINPSHTVARIDIPLQGNGVDGKSLAALKTLRNEILPGTIGQVPGATWAVTGGTANSADANALLKHAFPIVVAFVLTFAFLLLLVSFRSVVVAIKAIVLNLLSVGAAYGVLVAVFQNGWGEGLLNFQSNGGIAFWLPIFMFVILFGLSMDYHVFILSRVREAYDRGMSSDDAVAHGIKSTAGVVTSAAVVMVGAFAIFATLPFRDFKEMGIGLAAAVLIDATIVRGVLLPATMKLLGDWNWYLPKWLEWLPRLEHEASAPAPAPRAEPEPARLAA
jgi:putative drug exporter of the RND superfamily